MKNNYSLKRSFSSLVVKVVLATVVSVLVVSAAWLIWLSVFPRTYYSKTYSTTFLDTVEKQLPHLLSGEECSISNKDSRFQYLIVSEDEIKLKSKDFPLEEIELNKTSSGTHAFVKDNKMYSFKVFEKYPTVKVLMIFPAFSTGKPLIDDISIGLQYILVTSPFVFFIIFLSYFTTSLYKEIRTKFKRVEHHLKEIEEGNLVTPVPHFNDKEFGELSRQINKMRIELKELLDDSQRKATIQKHLFSSIAHDVKTPLTIINAETELIELCSNDTIVDERCSVIISEVSRVDQLLTELLKITRLNTESYTLDFSEVDCVASLHETLLEFSSLANKKEVSFREKYENDKCKVYGDRLMLIRIMQNILSNALEHVDRGGEIVCSVVCQPRETVLTISNTGSLFSDDYLEQGVVPFYSDEIQREKEHFGLGLYMSELMVKKMKGSLFIKNENQRATVCIVLRKSEDLKR